MSSRRSWLVACQIVLLFAVPVKANAFQDASPDYSHIILQDQPVAYWSFSESSDAKVIGSSVSSEYSAKAAGKPTLGQLGPRPDSYPLFSDTNRSIEFSGGKDLLQVDDPGDKSGLDFDSGESITLEAWVYPRTIGKDQHMVVLTKGRTGNKEFEIDNLNYALRLKGDSQVALVNFLYRSRSAQNVEDDDAKPAFHRWTSESGFPIDSGWHHIAVSYTFGQVGSLRAYLDGQPIEGDWDMSGDTGATPYVDNDRLWIGSGQANQSGAFQGWLDEVAIYRKTLTAQQIASRFKYQSNTKLVWRDAQDIPDDRVQVQLFQGLMDRTWGNTLGEPAFEFETEAMAFGQIPQAYNLRGVVVDRPAPILLQAYSKRWFPAGEYCIAVRAKNATRLWIDGNQVASLPFLTTNGDGHEQVPALPDPPQSDLHAVPQGHRDELIRLKLNEGMHVFRIDSVVGGKKIRPELGELCVAIAEENNAFVVLVPDAIEPWVPTEIAWRDFLRNEKVRMLSLNQKTRIQASLSETEYWDARHAAARKNYAQKFSERLNENLGSSIDQIVLGDRHVPSDDLIDDHAFLRRVTLDTTGNIPTRKSIQEWMEDTSGNKRAKKIEQLLSDVQWADHWVGYWQDVLAENPGIVKPEQNNTGPFRWWIHESFLDNKPMDRFATELIMMEGSKFFGGPAGFAMASQNDAPMAAKAQTLTKAFLGLEMSCARCHDSPNSPFKQEELFSLAAMLQRSKLSLPVSSTVPINPDGRVPLVTMSLKAGDVLAPQWHVASFPGVALPDDILRSNSDSREQFAAIVTAVTNERFPKVMVNRLWHRYMGWAVIEPVDDWTAAESTDSPLLQYLADHLVMSGYDWKHVARLILNSKVYQSKSITDKAISVAREQSRLPLGPARRRLSAEQFVDSLFTAAGKSLEVEPMTLDPEGRRPPEQFLHLGFPTRSWELASTSTDRDRPALMMPAVQQVADILIAMGWRDSRPTPLTIRDESASPLQSLILGNGLASTRLARLSDDSFFTKLAVESQSVEQLVTDLYLTVLGRNPRDTEFETMQSLLEPGFASRRITSPAAAPQRKSLKRNAVSWANHLVSEATTIKLALEQEILMGDTPTHSLETDWRERMEDASWTLLTSPEFLFVP